MTTPDELAFIKNLGLIQLVLVQSIRAAIITITDLCSDRPITDDARKTLTLLTEAIAAAEES